MTALESNPFLNGMRRSWTTLPPITKAMTIMVIAVHVLSVAIPAVLTLGKSWGSVASVCFYGRIEAMSTTAAVGGTSSPTTSVIVHGGVAHYIFTFLISTWAHAGLLHLLMNTMVLVTTGSSVEHIFSSPGAHLLFTIFLQLFTNGGMALVYSLNLFTPTCVVGLSGILFGYIAFECNLAHKRAIAMSQESPVMVLCGILPLKCIVLPWFLLVFAIVFMPGSSTLVHFLGLIAGMAVAWIGPIFDFLQMVGKKLDDALLGWLIRKCCAGRDRILLCHFCCANADEDDGTSSTSSSMCSNGTITPGGTRSPRPPYASKYSFGMLGRMRGSGPGDLVAAEEGEVTGDRRTTPTNANDQKKPYTPFGGEGRKLGGG